MEFRKMLMITLYAKQKKRHRCIEQSFGLCGKRRGWDVSREQHWNMYTHGWFISMYDKTHYNKKKKKELEFLGQN